MPITSDRVYTYQDAIDRLQDYTGGNANTGNVRAFRQSIIQAYEEIAVARRWNYLQRPYRLTYYGATTGTCSYTGGNFTIDSGSWPAWAAGATLIIGNAKHRITERTSSTVLAADEIMRPYDDIATGTEFTIAKGVYQLPSDFREMSMPMAENGMQSWATYVTPAQWGELTRYGDSTGEPQWWTVMPDIVDSSRMAIHVYPFPDTTGTVDFTMLRMPRQIRRTGFGSTDRVGTITSSGTAITGSSTSFSSDMVGSVIRIGDATNQPDGIGGNYPYLYQAYIKTYTSATALVAASSMGSLAGRKYTISDPIDFSQNMMEMFWRGCIYKLCLNLSLPQVQQAQAEYYAAINVAKNAEQRSMTGRSAYDMNMNHSVRQVWVDGSGIL